MTESGSKPKQHAAHCTLHRQAKSKAKSRSKASQTGCQASKVICGAEYSPVEAKVIDLQISSPTPSPTTIHPRPRLHGPPPPLPRQLRHPPTPTPPTPPTTTPTTTPPVHCLRIPSSLLPSNLAAHPSKHAPHRCCPLVLSSALECKRCSYRKRDPARPLRIRSANHSALPTT